LTVEDAARALECSPALVYKLVERGKLGHTRIGFGRGKITVSAAQVAEYRRGCEVAAVPDDGPAEKGARRPRPGGGPNYFDQLKAKRKGARG
jgi:excisionase family DNA binding protein